MQQQQSATPTGAPSYANPAGLTAQPLPGASALSCTSCGSDNTQALSVVYEGGLSHNTSQTSGFGVNGRGGLGYGTATTHGKSQTVQSQKAAPPQKKKWLGISAMLFVVALISFNMGGTGIIMFLVCGGAATYIGYTFHKYNQTVYPDRIATWKRTYVCNRCGTDFIPTGLLPAQPRMMS